MTQAAPPVVANGDIILARHGRPALSRRCWLSARQYRDWWHRYDLGGLLAGQTPPEDLLQTAVRAKTILSSTLPRAKETASAVAGTWRHMNSLSRHRSRRRTGRSGSNSRRAIGGW